MPNFASVTKASAIRIFCCALIVIVFTGMAVKEKPSDLKIELRNLKNDTISSCNCNIESRDMKLKARIWIPKIALQYDMVHIDLVKVGLLKYSRERNGDSYISFTKAELLATLNGKEYIDVEMDYYAYCDFKDSQAYVVVFGDIITGYKKDREGGKIVKTPVYVGGNGKELARSKSFTLTGRK